MMDLSDGAVVDEVRKGDVHAFRILVERHSRAAFRSAYRMTGNEQDAEDVVQEAFVRAFRRLNSFEQRSSFSAWLHRIVVNCSLDAVRARMRQPAAQKAVSEETDILVSIASQAPGPDQHAQQRELSRQIEVALRGLTPQERVAFVLRHFEGRSIEEIGGALHLRSSAAKNSVFRAVKKVREVLQCVVNTSTIL